MTDRYWVSFTMAMIRVPPMREQVGHSREWKTVTGPYIWVRIAQFIFSEGSTKQ